MRSFNTGLENEGHLILTRKEIWAMYLKSWFFIDAIATFPWSLVVTEDNYPYPVYSFFKCLKLARLMKVGRIAKRFEYALLVSSTVSILLKFVFVVMVASHWCSCMFVVLAFSNDGSTLYQYNMEGATILDQYVTAYYWAIMTMTTVGFGDGK